MDTQSGVKDTITVGFDGSEPSLAASQWALAAARAESATIHVVTAYMLKDGESIDLSRMRAEAIVNLAAKVDADDAGVVLRAIPGEPTEVLLVCAEDSRLLVVGRHGTSGIIHSALGSVGDACARLAGCPVVIVPPVRRIPSRCTDQARWSRSCDDTI